MTGAGVGVCVVTDDMEACELSDRIEAARVGVFKAPAGG